MDRMTIMGTDYAKLSLKTQATLRSVVANLPTDIQICVYIYIYGLGSSYTWCNFTRVTQFLDY